MKDQREEQQTLMHQLGTLQSEITLFRHSSAQHDVQYQDQNGAVDVQGLMQMMKSLKDEIKVMKGRHDRKKSHEKQVEVGVAAAPYDGQSACTGYPPSQDPSPAHSIRSYRLGAVPVNDT